MKTGALTTFIPLALPSRGRHRVALQRKDPVQHDITLLEGVARAFHWQHLIDSQRMKNGTEIARAEGLHSSVVNELLRLTLFAPDLIEGLMAGRQPKHMKLDWFKNHAFPVDWTTQRQIVQSFAEL